MKLDNLYEVLWLKDVRDDLRSLRSQTKERMKYSGDKDTETIVLEAINEAINKVEKAFEPL